MDGARRETVLALFRWLKEGPAGQIPLSTPLLHPPSNVAWLSAVTWEDTSSAPLLSLLHHWRTRSSHSLSQISQTSALLGKTRGWLIEHYLDIDDRLLFWIVQDDLPVGCLGFGGLDDRGRYLSLRDLMIGSVLTHELLVVALHGACAWACEMLPLEAVGWRVPATDTDLRHLASSCGFHEAARQRSPASTQGAIRELVLFHWEASMTTTTNLLRRVA